MHRMKMLVVFSQTEGLKYIGHLDLMRAMQRALRRSGLPVKYSQGFNPHIILGFAAPLSVGTEGLREVMEVPLEKEVSAQHFLDALNHSLPPLIRCVSARQVEDIHPAPMALCAAARFSITPLEERQKLLAAVPGFMERESIPAMRKSKKGMVETDIRPLIYNLIARDDHLDAVLALAESGTCKPELLVQALGEYAGISLPRCRIVRTGLLSAQFAPLEDA
jgi:radical SAM-linked protein